LSKRFGQKAIKENNRDGLTEPLAVQ